MANCRKCRKERSNTSVNRMVERSPDGRRANRRKAQRAAKIARMQELAAAAEHLAVEPSSGEAIGESVVSVQQPDAKDLAHGSEVQPVEGDGTSMPSGEVIEQVTEDESVPGVPTPDVTEGFQPQPVEKEAPLEGPVVSERDDPPTEG